MKAFLDESGKHGAAEMITVAGLLYRNREVKILQREWPKALGVIPAPYHHADFLYGKPPFDGIGEPERTHVQERLIDKMSDLDYLGFGASVMRSDLAPFTNRLRSSPAFRDPWFFVFESAISNLMIRTGELGRLGVIDFVFDRQDEFQERAHDIFNTLRSMTQLSYWARLGSLTFSPKDKVCPLQAVDLFTYEVNIYVRETVKKLNPERWQMRRLRGARDPSTLNGYIWDAENLEAVSRLKEEERGTSAFNV